MEKQYERYLTRRSSTHTCTRFLPLVKITSEDGTTSVDSMAEDRVLF